MSSSSSNDNSVRIRDYATAKISETTSERAAESIKNVAMGIVEASSSIRELVLTWLHTLPLYSAFEIIQPDFRMTDIVI